MSARRPCDVRPQRAGSWGGPPVQLKHETLNIGGVWDDVVSFLQQGSCARIDQKSILGIKLTVESEIENAMKNDEFKNKTPAEKVKFFRDELRKADPTFSLSEPKPGAVINTMNTKRRQIFMCMDQLIDESLEEREFRKELKERVEEVQGKITETIEKAKIALQSAKDVQEQMAGTDADRLTRLKAKESYATGQEGVLRANEGNELKLKADQFATDVREFVKNDGSDPQQLMKLTEQFPLEFRKYLKLPQSYTLR